MTDQLKVLAFSDLHRDLRAVERLVEMAASADLVLGAGDFATMRRGLSEVIEALSAIAAPTVLVPGNAESDLELAETAARLWPSAVVLHGAGRDVAGRAVFGLGYAVPVTPFGDWSCDLSEVQAERMLAACPPGAVMAMHSPPYGVADLSSDERRIGSTAIRAAIDRVRPPLLVCGHIHHSWGVAERVGDTLVANVGPDGMWFDLGPAGAAVADV